MICVGTRVDRGSVSLGAEWSHLADRPQTTWVGRTARRSIRSYGLQAVGPDRPERRRRRSSRVRLNRSRKSSTRRTRRAAGRTGFALKPAVTIAVATKVRRFSSPEVIGIIEGADARLKDEYVALMAPRRPHRHQGQGHGRPDQQRRARQRRRRRHADRSRARVHDGARTPAPVDPGRREHRRGEGPARGRVLRPLSRPSRSSA